MFDYILSTSFLCELHVNRFNAFYRILHVKKDCFFETKNTLQIRKWESRFYLYFTKIILLMFSRIPSDSLNPCSILHDNGKKNPSENFQNMLKESSKVFYESQ